MSYTQPVVIIAKVEPPGSDSIPAAASTSTSQVIQNTTTPHAIQALSGGRISRCFPAVVLGRQDQSRDESYCELSSLKLELASPNAGRILGLLSGGHEVSVEIQWEAPKFDRRSALWTYKAKGTFVAICYKDQIFGSKH